MLSFVVTPIVQLPIEPLIFEISPLKLRALAKSDMQESGQFSIGVLSVSKALSMVVSIRKVPVSDTFVKNPEDCHIRTQLNVGAMFKVESKLLV